MKNFMKVQLITNEMISHWKMIFNKIYDFQSEYKLWFWTKLIRKTY